MLECRLSPLPQRTILHRKITKTERGNAATSASARIFCHIGARFQKVCGLRNTRRLFCRISARSRTSKRQEPSILRTSRESRSASFASIAASAEGLPSSCPLLRCCAITAIFDNFSRLSYIHKVMPPSAYMPISAAAINPSVSCRIQSAIAISRLIIISNAEIL